MEGILSVLVAIGVLFAICYIAGAKTDREKKKKEEEYAKKLKNWREATETRIKDLKNETIQNGYTCLWGNGRDGAPSLGGGMLYTELLHENSQELMQEKTLIDVVYSRDKVEFSDTTASPLQYSDLIQYTKVEIIGWSDNEWNQPAMIELRDHSGIEGVGILRTLNPDQLIGFKKWVAEPSNPLLTSEEEVSSKGSAPSESELDLFADTNATLEEPIEQSKKINQMEFEEIRDSVLKSLSMKRRINMTYRDSNDAVTNLIGEVHDFTYTNQLYLYDEYKEVLTYEPHQLLSGFHFFNPSDQLTQHLGIEQVVSLYFTQETFNLPVEPKSGLKRIFQYGRREEHNYRFSFRDFVTHLKQTNCSSSSGPMFSDDGKPNNLAGFIASSLLGIRSDHTGIGRRTKRMTENQVFKAAFGFDSIITGGIMRSVDSESNQFEALDNLFNYQPEIANAEYQLDRLAEEWGDTYPKINDPEVLEEIRLDEEYRSRLSQLQKDPRVLLSDVSVLNPTFVSQIKQSLSESEEYLECAASHDELISEVLGSFDGWLDHLGDLINDVTDTFDTQLNSNLSSNHTVNPLEEWVIMSRQWDANTSPDQWEEWSEEVLDQDHPLANPSTNILEIMLESNELFDINEHWGDAFLTLTKEFKDRAANLIPFQLDVLEDWEVEDDQDVDSDAAQQSQTFSEIYFETLEETADYISEIAAPDFVETTFQRALNDRYDEMLVVTNDICHSIKKIIELHIISNGA